MYELLKAGVMKNKEEFNEHVANCQTTAEVISENKSTIDNSYYYNTCLTIDYCPTEVQRPDINKW